jgi:pimeloyl-ACP methyl ester carboxylesterase
MKVKKLKVKQICVMQLLLVGIVGFLHVVPVSAQPSTSPSLTQRDPKSHVRSQYLNITNQFATIDAVLYSQSGKPSPVGLVRSHPFSQSNLAGWPCSEIAASGVDILCFNNRFSNQELNTIWEQLALDVAAAVQEMRDRGYEHVVLFGHSAGGPLMDYYQNVAEHGNSAFKQGNTLSGFRGFFDSNGNERRLPAADALITVASTIGTSASFLLRLDGSVLDETTASRHPALDMFNPANGFNPATGTGSYSAAFLASYHTAQCDRMNRLIDSVQDQLDDISTGEGRFTDNDFIIIPGVRANPANADLSLAHATTVPYVLLPSGEKKIVASVRPAVDNSRRNPSAGGAAQQTLTSFLSYRAVHCANYDPDAVTPEASGVDFDSVNSTGPGNIKNVTVPILMLQGTADTEVHLTSAELNFNSATGTSDKTLKFIEGATHGFTPLRPEFGNTQAVATDTIIQWIAERFSGGRAK